MILVSGKTRQASVKQSILVRVNSCRTTLVYISPCLVVFHHRTSSCVVPHRVGVSSLALADPEHRRPICEAFCVLRGLSDIANRNCRFQNRDYSPIPGLTRDQGIMRILRTSGFPILSKYPRALAENGIWAPTFARKHGRVFGLHCIRLMRHVQSIFFFYI